MGDSTFWFLTAISLYVIVASLVFSFTLMGAYRDDAVSWENGGTSYRIGAIATCSFISTFWPLFFLILVGAGITIYVFVDR